MTGTFRSLAVPNYRTYAAGALISNVGTWMQRVAQAWLVLELTGSASALGIVTGLQLLPALLVGPVAGVVADRFPKRTVLLWTQLAMGVPALLTGVLAVTGVVTVWHVYLLTLVFGVATAIDAPTRQSFVAEMVDGPDLPNAVGLNSASFTSARLVGPGLAGVLIATLGSGVGATGWVFCINAASYAAVVLSLLRLDPDLLHPAAPARRGRGAVREGVRYARSRPDLVLILVCVFFVGTFGMNFQMTSALMATQEFDRGAGAYGVLGSILAVGSIVGALLAARRDTPRLSLVVGPGLAFGVLEVLSGLLPTYTTFAVVLPLLGLSALTMMTSANATIQMTTDPSMRGRMAALYLTVFMGGTAFGAPFIGWIGEVAGARATLWVGGGLSIGGIALALLIFRSMTSVETCTSSAPSSSTGPSRPRSTTSPTSRTRPSGIPGR